MAVGATSQLRCSPPTHVGTAPSSLPCLILRRCRECRMRTWPRWRRSVRCVLLPPATPNSFSTMAHRSRPQNFWFGLIVSRPHLHLVAHLLPNTFLVDPTNMDRFFGFVIGRQIGCLFTGEVALLRSAGASTSHTETTLRCQHQHVVGGTAATSPRQCKLGGLCYGSAASAALHLVGGCARSCPSSWRLF